MARSGIYTITTCSGQQYVGASSNLLNRWKTHRSRLRKGKHHSRLLQRAYDEDGLSALVFATLLICRREDLLLFERLAVKAVKPACNTATVTGTDVKFRHTAELRAEMSATRKGKSMPPRTDEQKNKYRQAQLGKKRTPQSLAKQSATLKGRKRAKPHSEAHRAALSQSHKGKTISATQRAALDKYRDAPRSAAHNKAISEGLKGKKHSAERRAAISAGRHRYYEKLRSHKANIKVL